MERLTKHFDYCKRIDCKFYDAELYKQGKCKFFKKSIEHCHKKRMNDKLREYEDAEQQGLLQKLPCKIGADVYTIPSKVNFELNVLSGHKENNRIYHQKIANIIFTEKGWYMTGNLDMEYGTGRHFLDIFYKETWFLTKEAAEAALKEMEK